MCARCRSRARHAMPARASSPGRSPSCSRSPGWSCRAGPGRRWPARRSNRRTGPRVRAENLGSGRGRQRQRQRRERTGPQQMTAQQIGHRGSCVACGRGQPRHSRPGMQVLTPAPGFMPAVQIRSAYPPPARWCGRRVSFRGPTVVKPGVVGQDCLRLCSSPSGQAVEEGDASRRTTWRPGGQATGRSTTRSTRQ